ncbi:hypothetical protein D3C72_2107740 [compost metagenome]
MRTVSSRGGSVGVYWKALVSVFGRGFAHFRLENEAAGTRDLHAGPQPLGDLHQTCRASSQRHRLRLEAVVGPHEYRGFVLDGLDGGFRYGDVRLSAVGGDQRSDKQAWTPGALRVFQGDANSGGAGLFA